MVLAPGRSFNSAGNSGFLGVVGVLGSESCRTLFTPVLAGTSGTLKGPVGVVKLPVEVPSEVPAVGVEVPAEVPALGVEVPALGVPIVG